MVLVLFRLKQEAGDKHLRKRDFYIKLIKNIKIEIFKKSGFGGVLVQFGVRIRILHDKCYIKLGSNPFFIDFRKIDFLEIQYFAIFRLPSYISACFDCKIKCALKKHVQGLIFIIFGWSLVLTYAKTNA